MNRKVIILSVAVATFAVGWAVRTQIAEQRTAALAQQDEPEALARAVAAYRLVAVTPIAPFADLSTLASHLRQVKPEADPQVRFTSADVESVLSSVAALFRARHLQNDPLEYVKWRQDAGYVFADREQVLTRSGEAAVYAAALGRPPADDQTMSAIFTDLWGAVERSRSAANTPRAIAADSRGLALTFGVRSTVAGAPRNRRPRPRGELGEQVWNVRPGAYVRWFVPAFEESLQNREVPAATFALIVEYADGSRRPLLFHLSRNPQRQEWLVDWITTRAAVGHTAELY